MEKAFEMKKSLGESVKNLTSLTPRSPDFFICGKTKRGSKGGVLLRLTGGWACKVETICGMKKKLILFWFFR
jgi:hypothetical protein